MIAVHPDRPDVVALVDAKAGDMHIDTGRYDIEAKSVEAARQFHYMSDCHRATFVFSDFGVLDVETVIRTGFYMGSNRDWGSTRGSGTPFVLVDKEHAWPFYEEFGRDPDSEVGEP